MSNNGLSTSESIPALEMMMRFAGARQRVLAHNLANIDTPGYRAVDVSPREFQKLLAQAVDKRRERNGGQFGALDMGGSREVSFGKGEVMVLTPREVGGVLNHDGNDRDLERSMQALVENAGAYRVAAELLRTRYALMNAAIAERL